MDSSQESNYNWFLNDEDAYQHMKTVGPAKNFAHTIYTAAVRKRVRIYERSMYVSMYLCTYIYIHACMYVEHVIDARKQLLHIIHY